jgi:hypothetical protein
MRKLVVTLVATAGLITIVGASACAAPPINPTGTTIPTTATKQVQYHPGHRHWHHRDQGYGHDSDADNLNQQELNRLGVAPQ